MPTPLSDLLPHSLRIGLDRRAQVVPKSSIPDGNVDRLCVPRCIVPGINPRGARGRSRHSGVLDTRAGLCGNGSFCVVHAPRTLERRKGNGTSDNRTIRGDPREGNDSSHFQIPWSHRYLQELERDRLCPKSKRHTNLSIDPEEHHSRLRMGLPSSNDIGCSFGNPKCHAATEQWDRVGVAIQAQQSSDSTDPTEARGRYSGTTSTP